MTEIHEVFLDDALRLRPTGREKLRFTPEQLTALRRLLACEDPDWSVLFDTYNLKKTNVLSFLMSEEFLNILLEMCREKYPYIAFSELFHTVRSMLLPLLYLLQQEVAARGRVSRDVHRLRRYAGRAGVLAVSSAVYSHRAWYLYAGAGGGNPSGPVGCRLLQAALDSSVLHAVPLFL